MSFEYVAHSQTRDRLIRLLKHPGGGGRSMTARGGHKRKSDLRSAESAYRRLKPDARPMPGILKGVGAGRPVKTPLPAREARTWP